MCNQLNCQGAVNWGGESKFSTMPLTLCKFFTATLGSLGLDRGERKYSIEGCSDISLLGRFFLILDFSKLFCFVIRLFFERGLLLLDLNNVVLALFQHTSLFLQCFWQLGLQNYFLLLFQYGLFDVLYNVLLLQPWA